MRPAQFDATMRKRGWSLARIARNGHHIYHHTSGASLTLDVDNAHTVGHYLAKYAKRDTRRAGGVQHG